MKNSRLRTSLLGIIYGIGYSTISFFFFLFLRRLSILNNLSLVSASFVFIFPIVIGFIPVFFSTREQLKSYISYIVKPWGVILTLILFSSISGFEGLICLVIIILPFLVFGSIGGFIARLIKLKNKNENTPLYVALLLPFICLSVESTFDTDAQFQTVETTIDIKADKAEIWENIKNVKNIQPEEIQTHFIHVIGVSKPLNGVLGKEGVGGVRNITWEKGIHFEEKIKTWDEGQGFTYDIHVDPESIPESTLDDHVKVGGQYFDVVEGGYKIDSLREGTYRVTLSCTYRVTTNFNGYSRLWADFILEDFNEMILEVIKGRVERSEK